MASLDFQLVASQLSVAQINVITILRLSTCKEKGKQKISFEQKVYTFIRVSRAKETALSSYFKLSSYIKEMFTKCLPAST